MHGTLGTHVNQSGGSQEKMVLLELFRVNNALKSRRLPPCELWQSVRLSSTSSVGEVGHGTLKFGKDGAGAETTGGKNTELRVAREMRIPLSVGDLDRTSWEVEFHIAGRMTALENGVGAVVSEVAHMTVRERRT